MFHDFLSLREHGRCTLLYWEIGMEARPTRNEKTAPKFSTQKNKK